MGRIDEALRRSNLDASQGTGAESPAPAASPWAVDQREGTDSAGPGRAPGVEGAQDTRADLPAQGRSERPARSIGFEAGESERLVVSANAGPLLVEQFRSLAATLHRAQIEKQLKSLIVTSASPGDGKSYVSVNLALTLSDSYRRRVLLVDADLRRPSLHTLFRIRNGRGLSDALGAASDEKLATSRITDTLTLLPAGRPEHDPLAGLSGGRMKRIIDDAASQFDWVIVDSPPVGVLADAGIVAETVDAAVFVVRAGVTRFEDLAAAADAMGRDRILGIVLNAVDPAEIRGQNYYRHYYGHGSSES